MNAEHHPYFMGNPFRHDPASEWSFRLTAPADVILMVAGLDQVMPPEDQSNFNAVIELHVQQHDSRPMTRYFQIVPYLDSETAWLEIAEAIESYLSIYHWRIMIDDTID